MRVVHTLWTATFAVVICGMGAACSNDATGPTSTTPLPFVGETATMRIYHEPGDTVNVDWQEAYNAWALTRLGLQIAQKVEYRKYVSREAMGRFTGNANTNGFAEPAQWRFHTIWPRDNHEIVHVYTDTVGRPSDFFNEGIAVAMQTDPVAGNLASVFNGQNVHDACRSYLVANTLPRPLANYVTTTSFRNLTDSVFSYRVAGSFVRYLIDRYGMPAVLDFFRQAGGRDETLSTIRTRAERVFGRTLEELEADWHAFLRS